MQAEQQPMPTLSLELQQARHIDLDGVRTTPSKRRRRCPGRRRGVRPMVTGIVDGAQEGEAGGGERLDMCLNCSRSGHRVLMAQRKAECDTLTSHRKDVP